ncbi:MAG TPA: hypothetical protein VGH79_08200 [Gaiellaceae bacterium]
MRSRVVGRLTVGVDAVGARADFDRGLPCVPRVLLVFTGELLARVGLLPEVLRA